ncbi:sce7726 family protein [Yersinia enterocolitica]|uniref:sce7726 family protein n=1 Tax=Yersinia enterocolitica TaxID=630 RepID=UPI0030BCA0B1
MLESKDAIQLFTSQAIQDIARGDYSLLYKVVSDYLNLRFSSIKISEVFDLTLNKASHDYRNEYFYKNIVANKIFLRKHSRQNATMLTEFRVGRSKADCVILNGYSTCYEIKTEFDNLKRLPEQLSEYSQIFDRVNIISSCNHLDKIFELTPNYIGVIELTAKGALKEVRRAEDIKTTIDPAVMIQSLRRVEYVDIASEIIGERVNVNNMDVFDHCMNIMKLEDSNKLRFLFRNALKKHRRVDYSLLERMPTSLVSSFISYKITPSHQKRLEEIMSNYITREDLCISH